MSVAGNPGDRLLPPGQAAVVAARRALVLAPHQDDEVLGCGGLVVQLVRRDGMVRVLFLTDGGGGSEVIADREAYRQVRRREAEAACRELGVAEVRFLDFTDGALEAARAPLAAALADELVGWHPDLVLVPSPLEASADHRATFAALHDVLGAVRQDDALGPEAAVRAVAAVADGARTPPTASAAGDRAQALALAVAGLEVLAYEVNHPGYPDLLVDVSSEVETLTRAMGCYGSQEERHRYLEAGLGLRRYRCLSLGREVTAAEGYRRLGVADFTTRSPAALVSALGGVPQLLLTAAGPAMSVVVRTRDRPRLLAEALASVAASSYRRVEVVLVNDGGAPPELAGDFSFPVRRVEHPTSRGRAAAANAGIAAATGDVVTFLDDDDLIFPEHLATLATAVAGLDGGVVYSDAAVGIYELRAGAWACVDRRLPYSRDFDPDLLLVDNYIPFNTLAIERRRLLALGPGPLDESLAFFEDWELLQRLAASTSFVHLRATTCEYRHFRGGAHHVFGERPADRPDFLATKAGVMARRMAELTPERLARIVERLRREIVGHAESAASTQASLVGERQEAARLLATHQALAQEHRRLDGAYAELDRRFWRREEEYHRLNGDFVALEGHRDRLLAETARNAEELGRLYALERELRNGLAGQGQELARLHAEVAELHPVRGELAGVRGQLAATEQALVAAGQRVGELEQVVAERDRVGGELTEQVRELAAGIARAQEEIARLHGEVARQAGDLAGRDAAIGGLQATVAAAQQREAELWREVQRLEGVVAAMESTRAWRLHRVVERMRGRG